MPIYKLSTFGSFLPTFYLSECENFGKKSKNVDFGHEGVFWEIFGLGKSCRALKSTFKNSFPITKI